MILSSMMPLLSGPSGAFPRHGRCRGGALRRRGRWGYDSRQTSAAREPQRGSQMAVGFAGATKTAVRRQSVPPRDLRYHGPWVASPRRTAPSDGSLHSMPNGPKQTSGKQSNQSSGRWPLNSAYPDLGLAASASPRSTDVDASSLSVCFGPNFTARTSAVLLSKDQLIRVGALV